MFKTPDWQALRELKTLALLTRFLSTSRGLLFFCSILLRFIRFFCMAHLLQQLGHKQQLLVRGRNEPLTPWGKERLLEKGDLFFELIKLVL